MAESTFNIKFKAQMKEIKKAFKEVKKQQKDFERDNKKRFKQEQRALKNQRSDWRKHAKERKDFMKHEMNFARSRYDIQKRQFKEQKRQLQEHRREFKKQEREARRQGIWGRRARRGGRMALGVGAGLVGGAIGMLVGGAMRSYGRYQEYGRALSPSIGLGPGRQQMRNMRAARGGRYGYSAIDVAQMNPIHARATGVTGPRELLQATRATALSGQEAGDIFGTIRRAGYSFAGGERGGESKGAREFRKQISLGMYSGLERARLPEFFKGVQRITEAQGGRRVGTVDTTAIAQQLALLGSTGKAGLQGQRGAAVFQKLNEAMIKPGGGEWGENFMRMAMGFGAPGSTTSFYEAEKMREAGTSDPENLMRMVGEVRQQFGGGQEGALAFRELTGLTIEQSEELMKIFESNKSVDEKLEEMKAVSNESKSLEQQAVDQMVGIGGILKRIAHTTDRAIVEGAKVAPYIEQLEDWSHEIFKKLVEMAIDIGYIVDWLRDKFGEAGVSDEELEKRRKEYKAAAFGALPEDMKGRLKAFDIMQGKGVEVMKGLFKQARGRKKEGFFDFGGAWEEWQMSDSEKEARMEEGIRQSLRIQAMDARQREQIEYMKKRGIDFNKLSSEQKRALQLDILRAGEEGARGRATDAGFAGRGVREMMTPGDPAALSPEDVGMYDIVGGEVVDAALRGGGSSYKEIFDGERRAPDARSPGRPERGRGKRDGVR